MKSYLIYLTPVFVIYFCGGFITHIYDIFLNKLEMNIYFEVKILESLLLWVKSFILKINDYKSLFYCLVRPKARIELQQSLK